MNIEKTSGGLEHSFFQFFQKILVIFSKTEGDSRESCFLSREVDLQLFTLDLLVDFTLTIKIEYFYGESNVSATCRVIRKTREYNFIPSFQNKRSMKEDVGCECEIQGKKSYES